MIQITLQDGTLVNVQSFNFKPTYLSLLEGKPSKEVNEFILEEISQPGHWGKRKALFIEPTQDEVNTKLKQASYCVQLVCHKPFNDYAGSRLVVIWMDDSPGERTIPAIIEQGIKDIHWENEAEGFNY